MKKNCTQNTRGYLTNSGKTAKGFNLKSMARFGLLPLLSVLLLASSTTSAEQNDFPPETTPDSSPNFPRLKGHIGHRCCAHLAPENTMSALECALDRCALIEVDVQRTRDGVLILMHDKTVNRTTNGKGKVSKLDWADISVLDAGSHFSKEFRNERVPTLQEALERIASTEATLVIEVKAPDRYPGIGDEIAQMIKATGTENHSIIISFDVGFIQDLKQSHPDISLGCLYLTPPPKWAPELQFVDLVSVTWQSCLFNKNRVRRIQGKGISVWGWTVNKEKKINKLDKEGIDGVVTDFPNCPILIKRPVTQLELN